MVARDIDLPLITIVGPTASGKTALAIELANRYNGEVICADSRTVFREMDIGTAKPTLAEQARVPHWGIDLVAPGERYTAAQFQEYANKKTAEIRARGKLPILVGGTGLYIDGVIYQYEYPAEASPGQREKFESMTRDELYKYCIDNNIELPINDKNKRHLVRSIIHDGQENKRRLSLPSGIFIYGIALKRDVIRNRIAERTEHMFKDGVVDEARNLGKKYGWNSESMSGNIYPLVREYLEGTRTLEDAKEAFRARDWQLAKRQMTWFRRNSEIAWGTPEDIRNRINDVLASG